MSAGSSARGCSICVHCPLGLPGGGHNEGKSGYCPMLLNQLLSGHPDWAFVLSWLVAITIALTVHEFAHAKAADRAGDPTPRMNGRVSLNPLDHYDPIGTTIILLFGIGWGKPVPINPAYFRTPRRDAILVSFAGPGSNFIVAGLFAIPLRFGFAGPYDEAFQVVLFLNLLLAFFNLLPIFPLDGSHILQAILPYGKAQNYMTFMSRYGFVVLIVLMLTGVLWSVVVIPCRLLYYVFTGLLPPF